MYIILISITKLYVAADNHNADNFIHFSLSTYNKPFNFHMQEFNFIIHKNQP